MTSVVVVYHSATGRTKLLAEAVARGAASVDGASARVLDVDEAAGGHDVLAAADAIVFGCPTYMGSASAGFKAFMDGTSAIWAVQGWRDKLAAGFTHSAAPSGDKLGTLVQLSVFAAQHGMVWVGLGLPPTYAAASAGDDDTNRLGSHLGAMAQSRPGGGPVPTSDVRTAEHLGRRIAEAARRWSARGETARAEVHPAARSWVLPPSDRWRSKGGVERVSLRELVARPGRFEHHLVVCASTDGVQLEITTASEPLYFAHINVSDEWAVALPSGDEIVDRFPLRTFLSDPTASSDVGRYNHGVFDLVLHPQGLLHWPGRLRSPFQPFDFPPGMRRSGLSLVYCASQPTRGEGSALRVPDGREGDVKPYVTPAPPMSLAPLRSEEGIVAKIGRTTLSILSTPRTIAPPRGAWVVVLEAAPESDHFVADLLRVPEGASLDATGIVRALVFTGAARGPDPAPSSWTALPAPPFAPFEDAPAGALPLEEAGLRVEERTAAAVTVSIGALSAEVPRYWLARTLFRVGLHGLRLGYVETYGGLFVDDRHGIVRVGLALGDARASIDVPRDVALGLVERLYRAVAPAGYTERLA